MISVRFFDRTLKNSLESRAVSRLISDILRSGFRTFASHGRQSYCSVISVEPKRGRRGRRDLSHWYWLEKLGTVHRMYCGRMNRSSRAPVVVRYKLQEQFGSENRTTCHRIKSDARFEIIRPNNMTDFRAGPLDHAPFDGVENPDTNGVTVGFGSTVVDDGNVPTDVADDPVPLTLAAFSLFPYHAAEAFVSFFAVHPSFPPISPSTL